MAQPTNSEYLADLEDANARLTASLARNVNAVNRLTPRLVAVQGKGEIAEGMKVLITEYETFIKNIQDDIESNQREIKRVEAMVDAQASSSSAAQGSQDGPVQGARRRRKTRKVRKSRRRV